jgi:hypothetical protein
MATPEETPPAMDLTEVTATNDLPSTPGEPTLIDITRKCRYSVIVSVPPSTEPWKTFSDLLKKFLKSLQEQTTKKLHIAPWDPELGKVADNIKKPSDFPEGLARNRKTYATYCSGYPNPQRGKLSRVYLKVRFVTSSPQDLPFELEKMGQELSEGIQEEMPIQI